MKILVLGCGSIGERHLKNLLSFFGGEIAVCDKMPARLGHIRDLYDVPSFDDYAKALKEFKPAAVVISTPTHFHVSPALEAIKSGCDVFVEKPLSNDLKEVNKLLQLARKSQKLVYVGFSMRFNPNLLMVKKLLDQGKLGKIYSARAYFGSYLPDRHPHQNYRQDYGGRKEMGGGVLLDAGSHLLDYLVWFFGKPVELTAYSEKMSDLEINVEDNVEMLIRFAGGVVVNLHADFLRRPWQHFLEIVAEKGTIVWSFSQEGNWLRHYDRQHKRWKKLLANLDLNAVYLTEMKDFVKCVAGRRPPQVDGKAAAEYLKILLKVLKTGKKQKIMGLRRN